MKGDNTLAMDIKLNHNQIKQFSLALSIDDVLNCIIKDYDGYLNFLNEELENENINQEEYNRELLFVEELKKNERKEVNNI